MWDRYQSNPPRFQFSLNVSIFDDYVKTDFMRKTVHSKNILIFLPAEDFNELEFSVIYETLKKHGVRPFIASDAVTCSIGMNGKRVRHDVALYNIHESNFDGLVIIGGTGITKYFENKHLHTIVRKFHCNKKTIGAICIAPVLLGKAGIMQGKKGTCFSEYSDMLAATGATILEMPVVADGNIITASGPDAALEFIILILSKI